MYERWNLLNKEHAIILIMSGQ